MTDDNSKTGFSRRKMLGSIATVGAAGALGGAATSALLWDEEVFGNADNPNFLQAGQLDLKVDWEGTYYNWKENPTFSSNGQVDQPGPIINLQDVKPGDVLEVTQSAHIYGNPAFLGWFYNKFSDTEGENPEPENKAEAAADSSDLDGDGGELDEYMEVVIWYDDGDNLPDEITGALQNAGVLPSGATIDDDDDGELDIALEDYVMALSEVTDASILQGLEPVVYAGTLADLDGENVTFRADHSNATDDNADGDGTDTDSNLVAEEFTGAGGEGYCYEASATEYIGVLAWVPRDIAGVDDNVIQGDGLEFQFGFDAIQCRHNVANDGSPMADTIDEADDEAVETGTPQT